MANPLATPALWKDTGNSVTPPSEWNASAGAYEFMGVGASPAAASLTYIGTFPTADFSFSAEVTELHFDTHPQVRVVADGVETDYTLTLNTPLTITVPPCNTSLVIEGYSDGLPGVGEYYSQVDWTPVIPPPPLCEEIGPTSRANASAYQRTRIHDTRLMLGESRCLVANFNGAIASDATITSVTWRCDYGYVAIMSNARIQPDNRSSAVNVLANWIGDSIIRCEATLENGEVYIQPFRIDVSGDPIFMYNRQNNGPLVLTAP
jgi:hypothetical protein